MCMSVLERHEIEQAIKETTMSAANNFENKPILPNAAASSDNHDPHGINKHLQVRNAILSLWRKDWLSCIQLDFANVFAEPDPSVYTFEQWHSWLQLVYHYSRLSVYTLLTILLAIPLMIFWGVVISVYSFFMIWLVAPARRLTQSIIAESGIYIQTLSDAIFSPLYRSAAWLFSNVRITLTHSSVDESKTINVWWKIKIKEADLLFDWGWDAAAARRSLSFSLSFVVVRRRSSHWQEKEKKDEIWLRIDAFLTSTPSLYSYMCNNVLIFVRWHAEWTKHNMLIIFQMTLTVFFTGPFHKSSWTWIDLIVGLLDAMFYIVSLNFSVPTTMTNDPQSFREINQTFELLRCSKECLQTNSTERLFHRVQFFILTYSFLLYIHQIVLWVLRYLSSQNFAWNSSTFIAAIVLLVQTFGLISFLQITEFYHCCSPLSLYLCLMSIRSFASIYAQIFRIDE